VLDAVRDFRFKLVSAAVDEARIDTRFRGVREEERPLVLLCGWAGATPKNLHKYSGRPV
jgi:hypothetical protein